MRKIVVNDEAMAAIRTASDGPFNQTARRNNTGEWEVPLEDDTFARLQEIRMKGESDSDVIIRMVAFWKSGGRSQ